MKNETVNPRGARFTDEQLRADLAKGLKPADIARKYEVSPAAVSKRVNRLGLTTTTAAVAPQESQRFVSGQINAIEQLTRGLGKVNRLMDACEEYLLDPDDPTKYNIGPRSEEVVVTWTDYSGEKPVKRKNTLAELLAKVEGRYEPDAVESKHADPRELILKTVQEARSTVTAAADLAKMLSDMQLMQQWREVVLNAIGRTAPDVREQIIREVQSSLVLRGLLEGPEGGHGITH